MRNLCKTTFGNCAILKPNLYAKFYFQSRSCSSGKQRRSRFPSAFMDKDTMPKMSLLTEDKVVSSGKGRSPSPPVRRSSSTDRGSVIKSRVKNDTEHNQPILKHPFPARVPSNKSLVTMPMAASLHNNAREHANSREPVKQESISETLFNLQKANSRKVPQELEEEQFKQALSVVRQGGIRKSKLESKVKAKHHQLSPYKIQFTGEMTVDPSPKSDYSEHENELRLVESAVHSAINIKKIHQNLPKNFQNLESRYDQY